MTVEKLIKRLSKYDEKTEVLIHEVIADECDNIISEEEEYVITDIETRDPYVSIVIKSVE